MFGIEAPTCIRKRPVWGSNGGTICIKLQTPKSRVLDRMLLTNRQIS